MPGWHAATKKLQDQGKLQVLGIVQEQHPERTKLFMQYKQMDWPVLVDPLNLLEVPYVPITLAIDERGIVRQLHPPMGGTGSMSAFVEQERDTKDSESPVRIARDPRRIKKLAPDSSDPRAWRDHGDDLLMLRDPDKLDRAIRAYDKAAELDPQDPVAAFRAGVAHRARYDSARRKPGDFQKAIEHWSRSLEIDPNNYIVRRRLQQYGPLLDKPYPFYDWVDEARQAIEARGEVPVQLRVEPTGSELAGRVKSLGAGDGPKENPDPLGRVLRDPGKLVELETTSVPFPVRSGEPLRVHLVFRTNHGKDVHWNNEVGPMVTWIDPPEGWQIDGRSRAAAVPQSATSEEVRRVEYELEAPNQPTGETLDGYALYYICEGIKGTCQYRRQDFAIPLR